VRKSFDFDKEKFSGAKRARFIPFIKSESIPINQKAA
jgi:hypothetical protein